ncbi:MAG: 23S rRNA (adenine(2503)-C(2))-methyltransferase RlmN [Candidatus Fermentibacteraceae bacterium]
MSGSPKIMALPRADLREYLQESYGFRGFRGDQVFSWMHGRRVRSFAEMTNIAGDARRLLSEMERLTLPGEAGRLEASDGTVKLLLKMEDGAPVEAVMIPEPDRLTACLSVQVGCRMGCTFCQTGAAGFRRNLGADEVVAQLYALQEIADRRISNVVLMGMGEPLDNLPAVEDALSIITDDMGICIGARKITVSTVGIPEGIHRLQSLEGAFGLALSLHSALQETRERLVPAARRWRLDEVRSALLDYAREKGRRVTLEYCLIGGVNDSREEAEALARFASGLPCKINLIVYNPVEGLDWQRPSEEAVDSFAEYLYPRCPAVTVRRSRGREVAAACGQLGASLLKGDGGILNVK